MFYFRWFSWGQALYQDVFCKHILLHQNARELDLCFQGRARHLVCWSVVLCFLLQLMEYETLNIVPEGVLASPLWSCLLISQCSKGIVLVTV